MLKIGPIVLVAMLLLGQRAYAQPQPDGTTAPCSKPDTTAHVVTLGKALTPPEAAGVNGLVEVRVNISRDSELIGTPFITFSPTPLLNAAAIEAARTSTYAARIAKCVPVSSVYRFRIVFGERPAQRVTLETPEPVAPRPASCAVRDAPAHVVKSADVETPFFASQQGIGGDVYVLISLNENSHLMFEPSIQRSTSVIFHRAAIRATKQSIFQTEIKNCAPVAADYIYVVHFEVEKPPTPAPLPARSP